MVTVEKQSESEHYNIIVNGEVIGQVYMTAHNQLSLIEIDPEHRGNGYGSAAFRAVIDDVLQSSDMYISTPVDNAIEPVLEDYPYRKTRDEVILIKQPDTLN